MSRISTINSRPRSRRSPRPSDQQSTEILLPASKTSTLLTYSVKKRSDQERLASDEEEGKQERLTGLVGLLDSVLKELLEYKLEASSASLTASRLVQILRNETATEKVSQKLTLIHTLVRNQAARLGLVTCPPLIRELIRLLQTTLDSDIRTEVALALQLLAKTGVGAEMIGDEFGIPVLIKLLSHPTEAICTTALYMLNQLMWYLPDEMRPRVRDYRGHLLMADLLNQGRLPDVDWLVICMDAIRMAVFASDQTKLEVLDTGLHQNLVRLLRTYLHNPKMAYNAARLIKVLGTCNRNKVKLVASGAVETLTSLLSSDNQALVLEALWGLRNISDRAYHINDAGDATVSLIPTLITLLSSADENISICTAGCLCNLTCQNVHNKQVLVEKDGVKSLCQLLLLNHTRQEIAEPICSALRHVTHRNENSASAIYEIRVNQAIPTIALILHESQGDLQVPLLKSVLGVIRNIAAEEESREQLRSEEVPKGLLRILRQFTGKMTSTLVAEATQGLGSIEGVNVEDLLELVLLAMQAMAVDGEVRDQLVHTAGCVATLVQLLYLPLTSLQRAVGAVLSQLSTCKAGAVIIERQGVCPRLAELIQSENEYIVGYSAAILHRITRDKPADYRHRLNQEIRQALFDGGLAEETGTLRRTGPTPTLAGAHEPPLSKKS